MIGLMLYGAGLGALIFAAIWKVAPPKPSPLVQLGRFEARQATTSPRASASPLLIASDWPRSASLIQRRRGSPSPRR